MDRKVGSGGSAHNPESKSLHLVSCCLRSTVPNMVGRLVGAACSEEGQVRYG